jgi:hypothetical protein
MSRYDLDTKGEVSQRDERNRTLYLEQGSVSSKLISTDDLIREINRKIKLKRINHIYLPSIII